MTISIKSLLSKLIVELFKGWKQQPSQIINNRRLYSNWELTIFYYIPQCIILISLLIRGFSYLKIILRINNSKKSSKNRIVLFINPLDNYLILVLPWVYLREILNPRTLWTKESSKKWTAPKKYHKTNKEACCSIIPSQISSSSILTSPLIEEKSFDYLRIN